MAIVHATLMTVIKIKMLINSHRNGYSDTNEPLPEGKLSGINGSEDGMIIN